VLEIFHRHKLDPNLEWIEFLETLAGQAAIAIDNLQLFGDLQTSNLQLRHAYDATIEGWAQALELHDPEPRGYNQLAVDLTLELARMMDIDDKQLVHIRRGALLHDIGKMGVSDSILQKPGRLSDDEWEIIRRHPVHAYKWLAPILYLKPALDIPHFHHEKWNGTGYPHGLKGDQIPLSARIFAVVDVWLALLSDRPYRKAWKKEKALAHIREQSGVHFDPRVVDAFIELINRSGQVASP
jgi:HD-GYP domain-containing protein (c-di-GMP phosphodiesterase class II)